MNTEHWETFLSIVETNSFSGTAERLRTSQTTVTNRIQQLERKMGKELFVRDTRTVRLSDAGAALYPYAKKAMELLREGAHAARSHTDSADRLNIGSHLSIWHYYLLPKFNELLEQHAQLAVKVYAGQTRYLFDLLLDGLVDACVIPTKPQHPDCEFVPLLHEPYALVGHPSFAVGAAMNAGSLSRRTFAHIPWESPFAEWFQTSVAERFVPALEIEETTIFIRTLIEQRRMGFVPEMVAKAHVERGELARIPFESDSPLPTRTVYLAYRKGSRELPALKALAQLLQS